MHNLSSLIGTKYLKNGRNPKEGLDCLGLCIEAYKRMGVEGFPDLNAPDDREMIHSLMMSERDLFEEVKVPEEGNIVAISIRPPYVTHMGVMINKQSFIHIIAQHGCIVSRLNDAFWGKRIKGVYKWKNSKS